MRRAVIDDWYDDGRVDGTYALHCYDDAIEILPRDVRDYSSAKEDIQRALQAAKRGEDAPPARTDPTPGGTPTKPERPTSDRHDGGRRNAAVDRSDQTATTRAKPWPAARSLDDSASSVPIPLLILAGLALLLIAAGTAGYVIRRLQARRLPAAALQLGSPASRFGGYTSRTVSRFNKRFFASVRCWV